MTSGPASWEAGRPVRELAVALVSGFWALLMRAWHRSLRFDTREAARLDAVLAEGHPVVVVFWHGNYLPLFAGLSGRPALVATSLSFRGAVIAGIARRFGYRAVQVGGRPHSTGEALRRGLARPGGLVAIAVDGPLGPRHVVKPGAVAIAARTGARIVPVEAIAASRITLSWRWDQMELPLPFSRVVLRVGPPLDVVPARDLDAAVADLARALLALERVFQPLVCPGSRPGIGRGNAP